LKRFLLAKQEYYYQSSFHFPFAKGSELANSQASK
jgi:hypothetical protein